MRGIQVRAAAAAASVSISPYTVAFILLRRLISPKRWSSGGTLVVISSLAGAGEIMHRPARGPGGGEKHVAPVSSKTAHGHRIFSAASRLLGWLRGASVSVALPDVPGRSDAHSERRSERREAVAR